MQSLGGDSLSESVDERLFGSFGPTSEQRKSSLTESMERAEGSINSTAAEVGTHRRSDSEASASASSDGEERTEICLNCASPLEEEERMVCSGCMEAHYCSRDCQEQHWPTHKTVCSGRHCRQEAYVGKSYALPLARSVCFDVAWSLWVVNAGVVFLFVYVMVAEVTTTGYEVVLGLVLGLALVNMLALCAVGVSLAPYVVVPAVVVQEEGLLLPGPSPLKVRGVKVLYSDICRVDLQRAKGMGLLRRAGLSDNLVIQTRDGVSYFVPHSIVGKGELIFFLRSFFQHIFIDPALLEEVHLTTH